MEADRTLYLRNITPDITESLLHELFLQAGPIDRVNVKDKFAFVTFEDEESVLYACSLFEGLQLYGIDIPVRPRAGSRFANVNFRSVPPYTFPTVSPHHSMHRSPSTPLMPDRKPLPFTNRAMPSPYDTPMYPNTMLPPLPGRGYTPSYYDHIHHSASAMSFFPPPSSPGWRPSPPGWDSPHTSHSPYPHTNNRPNPQRQHSSSSHRSGGSGVRTRERSPFSANRSNSPSSYRDHRQNKSRHGR